MGSLAENQRTCMKCAHVGWRHGQGGNGVVPCVIDGKDILVHYTTNECPKKFFADGVPDPPRPSIKIAEGPKRWAALHRRALAWQPGGDEAAELNFIRMLAYGMGCACNNDWGKIVKADLPDFSSAAVYFAKTVRWHNAVNRKLNKLELQEQAAWQLYAA